ncbi:hypothetical protein QL285_089705 [Trifolium repens]|nr:hypothetical protein QL285_089705 [Trifolium repens]
MPPTSGECSNMNDDSAIGASAEENVKMTIDSAAETNEDDIIITAELSATAESNPTMAELKMKTPAKRMVSEDNRKSERNSAMPNNLPPKLLLESLRKKKWTTVSGHIFKFNYYPGSKLNSYHNIPIFCNI